MAGKHSFTKIDLHGAAGKMGLFLKDSNNIISEPTENHLVSFKRCI